MAKDIEARKISSLPELVPLYVFGENDDNKNELISITLKEGQYNIAEYIDGLYLLLAYRENINGVIKSNNFKLKLKDLINVYIRNFIQTTYIDEINDKLNELNELTQNNYATKDDIIQLSNLISKYHPDGAIYNILYNIDDNIRIISWKNTISENEIVSIIYDMTSSNYKLDTENISIVGANYEINTANRTILLSNPTNNVTVTLRSKKLNSLFAVIYTNTELTDIFGNSFDYNNKMWVTDKNNLNPSAALINNVDYKYFTDEIFNTFTASKPILRKASDNGHYTIIVSKKYIDSSSVLSADEGSFANMKLIFKDSNGDKYELFSSDAAMFGNPKTNVHIDFDRPYGEFKCNIFKDTNNNYPTIDNEFVIIRFNLDSYSNLYFYKL